MERVNLLDDDALHKSPVVANCTMNRERQLSGSNGYSFELKLDITSWLASQLEARSVRWLDVCCGTGRALIEATQLSDLLGHPNRLKITGIDLAGHFLSHNSKCLELVKSSIESWHPQSEIDLITCVHGLHYIGDKLAVVKKLANCLSENGVFLANIDLGNLRFRDGGSASRTVVKRFKEHGIEYDKNNRLIHCRGGRTIESFGLGYYGADDDAGPNYTGQPAVNSYYGE